ncbi:YraN family protein [Desulfatiglans anilini]|uniref:YraN family protein n=1 Tax=Desulfatiglans anilini TaxID=90728 RepID=UPI0006853EBD|nr:YraN family protein [Desulfatiglans anilini]
MTRKRMQLGQRGEQLALEAVKQIGYRPVHLNYRCPLGELDLIAKDGDTLVFIEIKTRSAGDTGPAKEAVDRRKQRRLSRLALNYLKTHGGLDTRSRFDVVAVGLSEDQPKIEIVKNAFELLY